MSVTLTATNDADSTFTSWLGAGCSGTGTCTVTMDAAQNVTATFTLLTGSTITIKGTLFLPPGMTATSYEYIDINIYDADSLPYTSFFYEFAKGKNSLEYSVEVPEWATETWRVGYHVYNNNDLKDGYFSSSGTVEKYSMATPLSASGDHSDIDMMILRAAGGLFPWNMFLPAIIGRTTH